ncbi:MBL fold metallo-hydrolase [Candidatus Latescibacteria bacterium]|jgi:hydroxyacylglutathione hydrolase|nr:MBL fold metallo-hydrolase [Candidatus Latescibacterota bacterium]
MLFERFEDQGLAQYSYAVGCPGGGKIAIVDPRRDIDIYLEFAQAHHVEIAYVLETHIHADYASGAKELAQQTNAELWVSGYDKGEAFEVAFPHHDLFEGDSIKIGMVRIEVLHTPGHTPEHLSFLIYDEARSKKVPMLMLSGDFLFVGSLGRPDLLGEDAKLALAKKLFHSVSEKIKDLPDGLEIHPGHGAGSMCGSGMSGRPVSTLGFERIANPYLCDKFTEDEFVKKILSTVPPFPEYYKRMKKVNSAGLPILNGLPGLKAIELSDFQGLAEADHVVIDLRDQLSFGAGHIPGSFGIGAGQVLSTWASWVVPYDTPILLVAPDSAVVESAVRSLVRVGLDQVQGYLKSGIEAWEQAGNYLKETPQITPVELYETLQNDSKPHVLDVRNDTEWAAGHIAGAVHVMGGELEHNLQMVPNGDTPLAVVCGSGYRSTVAISLLERAGFDNLINVTGGIGAWAAAALPLNSN